MMLDPRGQVGQLVEQAMLVGLPLGSGELLIDAGELPLHRPHLGGDLPGHRQGEEGHQPVGLHLEHALN
jgi:hypothetical protein